ncbi:hypothetical protein F5148DRAFT_342055 [Russula earlei]|uniref:Uncharacterized protein n=1 Tax=Russula earlei TaxID=71964 RepID=A0ACC0U280_9AGAM|nr:hypothetical protein F5148DRAFT_342055 [Russula earlei]
MTYTTFLLPLQLHLLASYETEDGLVAESALGLCMGTLHIHSQWTMGAPCILARQLTSCGILTTIRRDVCGPSGSLQVCLCPCIAACRLDNPVIWALRFLRVLRHLWYHPILCDSKLSSIRSKLTNN